MNHSMNKYLAEAVGTFGLAFAVALAVSQSFGLTPFLAALVLGGFVYSIGSISGAHINPAITLGLFSINKISSGEAVRYILAQGVGGGIALLVLMGMGITATVSGSEFSWPIAIAETVGTFFFAFGVASVATGKAPESMSGIVVGSSLLIGIIIASLLGSAGVLNPAVSIGLNFINPSYFLGPIVGAILGMQVYKKLQG